MNVTFPNINSFYFLLIYPIKICDDYVTDPFSTVIILNIISTTKIFNVFGDTKYNYDDFIFICNIKIMLIIKTLNYNG